MKTSPDDAKSFLKVALAAIEKSDAFINDKVRKAFTTKTKKDGSFVTDVDTGVEQLIRRLLRNRHPDHDITGRNSAVLQRPQTTDGSSIQSMEL